MKTAISWAALGLSLAPLSGAATPPLLPPLAQVTVTIPSGDIVGYSAAGVESFNGIPYADPPTGDLRMKPPQKLSTPLGTFNATGKAKLCPQGPIISVPSSAQNPALAAVEADAVIQSFGLPAAEGDVSEDCLTITVTRPAGTQPDDALPVLFYIFGGGFLIGGTSAAVNDPVKLVQTGALLGKPFIFAAVNYRVGGWGFMPGEDILREGSANAGLLDQRMGLEWVADNIEAFGGNSSEVTIWGQSAGSISVWDQLVLYDGDATYNDKPLFRGAIMNSGSVTPVDPVDSTKANAVYQHVVEVAGCEGDDSLGCLRNLTNDEFAKAANSVPGLISYESLALSYLPRPDGKVLTASPHVLAREGKFHAVPMIFGSQEDEGTLFSLAQFLTQEMGNTENITDYLSNLYFPNAEYSLVREFVETYSERVEDGSPFRTGQYVPPIAYPGKKRLAAILGDIVFTLVRRWTLENVAASHPDVPVWSSFASYNYLIGLFGTQHGSDTTVFFDKDETYFPTRTGRAYYINFVHNLDPNVGLLAGVQWPKWTEGNELLWYKLFTNEYLKDDFRSESYEFIKEHIDSLTF